MTRFSNSLPQLRKLLPLLVTLALTAPVIFFQAFRYNFPLGYAGMFTLIAEKISQANFALPLNIPHYGPGGIDLVYPPFGMYIFALAIKLGIPTWFYLRVVPAIFTLLALIPLYYFALELIESKVAAAIAIILIITQTAVYYTHVWSAGVVRALALGFCMAGLFFYVRSLREFSWRNLLFAGLFLGLTLTTHLLYVAFAVLVGVACLISEWKPSRLLIALGILGVALVVAAPWLILILERHGLSALFMALSSHRNTDFFTSLREIVPAVQFITDNLAYVTGNWGLMVLALPGFLWLLARRKFQLPLAFLLVLFMGEASFYAQILAGIMAGAFAGEVVRWTASKLAKRDDKQVSMLLSLLPALLILIGAMWSITNGVSQIAQYQPEINQSSLEMASFVRGNTDPNATYLFVGRINEAEWFPYLLDRTPVFALWGSEWKGIYAEQLEALNALRECQLEKDWTCMEEIQVEHSVSPDLLIVPNRQWLVRQIKDTKNWDRLYTDEFYLVWQRRN